MKLLTGRNHQSAIAYVEQVERHVKDANTFEGIKANHFLRGSRAIFPRGCLLICHLKYSLFLLLNLLKKQ